MLSALLHRWAPACGFAAFLACWTTNPSHAAEAETAAEILRQTGVRGGFVVHLGCGDGRLTAALRASEAYMVHGLSSDAGQVKSARERLLQARRLRPRLARSARGDRLPYIDNFVNLVVAEDPGAVTQAGDRARALPARCGVHQAERPVAEDRQAGAEGDRRLDALLPRRLRATRWPTIRSSPRRSDCNGSARRAARGITTAWPA